MELLYDIQKIMELLPHRYPFLLIDRVVSIDPGKKILALKNVTISEPWFQGHFPTMPIMPGVLIVEAMGQAGAVLVSASLEASDRPSIIYFMGMDKVRFRKPVVPGDQLLLEINILKIRKRVAKIAGIALVDEQKVAEAELLASFGE